MGETTFEIAKKMEEKLARVGLGFESIKVFGVLRCYVHVTCISLTTANAWAAILSKIFKGAFISVTPTIWEAKKNRGIVGCPTMRKGFLIVSMSEG
jgi:hypothetical protein